jgi:hypothetical protein
MRPLDRREFLDLLRALGLGLPLSSAALAACAEGVRRDLARTFPDLPPQAACRTPGSAAEKTLLAFVDAVVPGRESDPTGEPGAVEACALNVLFDPALPFAGITGIFVSALDSVAQGSYGRPFAELDLDSRTRALVEAESRLPVLGYAFKFVRAAFYVGLYNHVGPDLLGYPGGNLGYLADPDFSLRRPVGRERTSDGNMP